MAKHFTTMTFQNYLLSAYYVLALSPDARLERTAKKSRYYTEVGMRQAQRATGVSACPASS